MSPSPFGKFSARIQMLCMYMHVCMCVYLCLYIIPDATDTTPMYLFLKKITDFT